MGHTTRNLSYNSGTDTLSGTALHDQEVHIHVLSGGDRNKRAPALATKVKSSKADGSWSLVTGLASGTYTVVASLNGVGAGLPLTITKP